MATCFSAAALLPSECLCARALCISRSTRPRLSSRRPGAFFRLHSCSHVSAPLTVGLHAPGQCADMKCHVTRLSGASARSSKRIVAWLRVCVGNGCWGNFCIGGVSEEGWRRDIHSLCVHCVYACVACVFPAPRQPEAVCGRFLSTCSSEQLHRRWHSAPAEGG